jgi:hypothetical protein
MKRTKKMNMKKTAMTIEPANGAGAERETLSPGRNAMKLGVALLLMGTTLGAGSAAFAAGQGLSLIPDARLASRLAPDVALTLIDDDGDEGDDDSEGGWFWSLSGEDDEDDDDDCDEGDDDDCVAGSAGNAAKAGTAPPPQNGLFTNGTAPVVKSN